MVGELGFSERGYAALFLLGALACGRTHADERARSAGDAGAPSGAVCTAGPPLSESASAAPRALPYTLEGTLCGPQDRLWLAVDPDSPEANRPAISARLVSGSATATYTVALFSLDEGNLQPLLRASAPQVFALSEEAPELLMAPWPRGPSPGRVVLELTGPEGPVAVEVTRPELPPQEPCNGSYQALSSDVPTVSLPTVLDARLCNGRDSLAWAIEVVSGRAVSVTLENPLAIDDFRFDVYRLDVDGYEHLPVTAGVTSVRLGLLAERSFSFTPQAPGSVGLYAASGVSRTGPPRLRVEQAP